LLLAYPLVGKTIHVHHHELFHHNDSSNTCFDQSEESCPVCNFEFYSFIPSTQITTFLALQNIPIHNSPTPEICYGQVINYFSLRAPPVA